VLALAASVHADFFRDGLLVKVDTFGCEEGGYTTYELKAPDSAEYAPWIDVTLKEFNEPATCLTLKCAADFPDCMDRVTLIEAEAKMKGFDVCVQNEGSVSNNNDNVNTMCAQQVQSCRNPQYYKYETAGRQKLTEFNIKFFCDTSCPSSDEELSVRVRQSVERFEEGDTDALDEWCQDNADATAWPSYQEIKDYTDNEIVWDSAASAASQLGALTLITAAVAVAL